mmetsp:Transcript_45940/g.67398  ORF Transcript_45940/g.67398 Transcript_45940/m.67398 type:complete len:450 (+) Transcript_45940:3534-4883(+)
MVVAAAIVAGEGVVVGHATFDGGDGKVQFVLGLAEGDALQAIELRGAAQHGCITAGLEARGKEVHARLDLEALVAARCAHRFVAAAHVAGRGLGPVAVGLHTVINVVEGERGHGRELARQRRVVGTAHRQPLDRELAVVRGTTILGQLRQLGAEKLASAQVVGHVGHKLGQNPVVTPTVAGVDRLAVRHDVRRVRGQAAHGVVLADRGLATAHDCLPREAIVVGVESRRLDLLGRGLVLEVSMRAKIAREASGRVGGSGVVDGVFITCYIAPVLIGEDEEACVGLTALAADVCSPRGNAAGGWLPDAVHVGHVDGLRLDSLELSALGHELGQVDGSRRVVKVRERVDLAVIVLLDRSEVGAVRHLLHGALAVGHAVGVKCHGGGPRGRDVLDTHLAGQHVQHFVGVAVVVRDASAGAVERAVAVGGAHGQRLGPFEAPGRDFQPLLLGQ